MNEKIKKIIHHGFSYIFFSSLINKIINFLCNSAIVQLLDKEDYGIYVYAYNIISFALILAGFGIPAGLLQVLSEHSDKKAYSKSLFQCGTTLAGGFNIFLVIIVLLGVSIIPLKIPEAKLYVLSLACIPFFDTLLASQLIYMRSMLMTKQYAFANNINAICISIFSVLGAYWGGIYGLILGKYCAYIVSIILFAYLFKIPFFFTKVNVLKKDMLDLIKVSLVSVANNGMSELLYILDIFIMGLTIANQEVIASYKVATLIPTALTFIPSAIITYVYPIFAKNRDNRLWLKVKYRQLLISIAVLNFCVIVPLFLFAPFIVNIFWGNEYGNIVLIFRILLLNYFISGTFRIISGNLLVTQRALKFNFYVAMFSSIGNTLGNILFIPRFGAMGAVITTVSVVIIVSIISTLKLYCIIYKGESAV